MQEDKPPSNDGEILPSGINEIKYTTTIPINIYIIDKGIFLLENEPAFLMIIGTVPITAPKAKSEEPVIEQTEQSIDSDSRDVEL